jgi:hypothetical protein
VVILIEEIGTSVMNPLLSIYRGFIDVLPGLIGAVVVLIVGYIIAVIVSVVVSKICEKIKLDKLLIEKTKIKKLVGDLKLSKFLAVVTKWYVFILFLPPAAGLVKLTALTNLLNAIALWVPHIILAIIVALIGFLVAEYVAEMIVETKTRGARLIADAAKFVIIVIFALVVLEQIGIKITLVQNAVLVLLAGVVLAFALGLGLAFGLGGREDAKVMITEFKKKL